MNTAQNILDRIAVLEMSVNSFGKIAHISSGEISSRLNGTKPLGAELERRLPKLVSALEELQRIKAAPLNWKDTDDIIAQLKQREEAKELELRCQELLAE